MIYASFGMVALFGVLYWLARRKVNKLVKENTQMKLVIEKAGQLILGQSVGISDRNKLIAGLQKKVVELGGNDALVDMLNGVFENGESGPDGMLN